MAQVGRAVLIDLRACGLLAFAREAIDSTRAWAIGSLHSAATGPCGNGEGSAVPSESDHCALLSIHNSYYSFNASSDVPISSHIISTQRIVRLHVKNCSPPFKLFSRQCGRTLSN